MKLKKLFIVRHGEENVAAGGILDPEGIRQMESLGKMIKSQCLKAVKGTSTRLLTSTAVRAKQSAEILGRILETPVEEHEVLWSEGSRPVQLQKVLALIDLNGPEVVILVTHLEYAMALPYYFGKYALGGILLPFREVKKGSAYVIDCEKQKADDVIVP